MNAVPNNLPVQLTSFIGRDHELAEVKRLLTTTRLLTLTGSGGTGKTRLALHVAGEVLNQSADGVWFIELAPLSDPALVPVAIASVLGVQQEHGRPLLATLLDWLRPKQLLLILDNCEHLIAACAALADGALHSSREMRILATSREALGIAGETTYRVPSLDTPTPRQANSIPFTQLTQFPAVRLFSERAVQSQTSFQLTAVNAKSVAQICYQLDGIPLAIELAAARVKVLSAEKIAERLDDRFRLLTGGSRTALPRQQTLRGAIDWSHILLSEPERVLLRRLAVFADTWTLEAAEVVCAGDGIMTAEVLDLLTHLVDKSLVVVDGQSAELRYRMLETIRQYAREKLLDAQEGERLRDRHLKFFFDMVEHAEPLLLTAHRAEWIPRLELEHDNLRAALEWACERDVEVARQLAANLRWFWNFGDHLSEAFAWYTRVLGLSERATRSRGLAGAFLGMGQIANSSVMYTEGRAALEQSSDLWRKLGDQRMLAESLVYEAHTLLSFGQNAAALEMFGNHETVFRESAAPFFLASMLSAWGRALAEVVHDYAAAKALYDESIAVGLASKDPVSLARSFQCLGYWATAQEDFEAARRYYLEGLSWCRQGGPRWLVAVMFRYVADATALQGDNAQALQSYDEALAMSRALGNQLNVAKVTCLLGYVVMRLGDAERAASHLAECLTTYRERNYPVGIAECLTAYAALRCVQGQAQQAVRVLAYVEALCLSLESVMWQSHRIEHARSVTATRALLGADAVEAAWAEGCAMTMETAIAEAQREPSVAQRAAVAPPSSPDNLAGLSAREIDVLRLLAVGLTNHQIAAQLVLSTYTVQAHLRSVYSKLGVANRSAATRYATDHDLV